MSDQKQVKVNQNLCDSDPIDLIQTLVEKSRNCFNNGQRKEAADYYRAARELDRFVKEQTKVLTDEIQQSWLSRFE